MSFFYKFEVALMISLGYNQIWLFEIDMREDFGTVDQINQKFGYTVESLYLDYPLSRISLYLEHEAWSLEHLWAL